MTAAAIESDAATAQRARPKLFYYLVERDIPQQDFAERIPCKPQQLSRWLKRWDDPDRQIPPPHRIGRMVELTDRAVTAADWYPPELNGALKADDQPMSERVKFTAPASTDCPAGGSR